MLVRRTSLVTMCVVILLGIGLVGTGCRSSSACDGLALAKAAPQYQELSGRIAKTGSWTEREQVGGVNYAIYGFRLTGPAVPGNEQGKLPAGYVLFLVDADECRLAMVHGFEMVGPDEDPDYVKVRDIFRGSVMRMTRQDYADYKSRK